MKLSNWIVQNLDKLELDIEEVYDEELEHTFLGIRFVRINKPGYHTHDELQSHAVAIKHFANNVNLVPTGIVTPVAAMPKINRKLTVNEKPTDYHAACDAATCEEGKYRKKDNTFNICFRCGGKGYLTKAKYLKNQEWDRRQSNSPSDTVVSY